MDLTKLTQLAIHINDLFKKLEKKNQVKEWNQQQIMEGFVVDVGDLMRLVMAKENYRTVENVDQKLEHELADCLWSILVLAKLYNIDLKTAFLKTMTELEENITKKLP